MERSKKIKKMATLAVAFLCVLLCPLTSYALEGSTSESDNGTPVVNNEATKTAMSASITISGKHIVENKDSLKTGRHTFVLTADDKSYPMPEGSENGIKKVTISSNEDFSFGKIDYNKPGDFSYTISRELTKSKELKEDNSVYNVRVVAYNTGETVIVIKKSGESAKAKEILYKDKYVKATVTKTGGGGKTQTSDQFNMMAGAILCLSALGMIIGIANRRKRTE